MSLVLREHASPHHDPRPPATTIDTIVLHTAATRDDAGALATLTGTRALATLTGTGAIRSAHYLVGRDGVVWRLVAEARRTAHAGPSWWRGRSGLDDRSIGIALTAPDPREAGYPVLQLVAACDLCLAILSRHAIAPVNIVGLGDIAPDRAEDPGALFDWEGLARNGVGLWPDDVPDFGTGSTVRDAARLRDVRAALAMIGYRIAPEGPLDPALSTVLRAFQRHWRPEAVNGQADAGTLVRLLAVARLAAG